MEQIICYFQVGIHLVQFGLAQDEYLNLLLDRILINGYSRENISECVSLLLTQKDPDCYSKQILYTFESYFNNNENRKKAIEILNLKVNELKEEYSKLANKKGYVSSDRLYYEEEKIEFLVECTLDFYLQMYEVEEGISYYNNNCMEKNKEYRLYFLLNKLEENEFYEKWVKEYEKGKGKGKNKIEYSEKLIQKYENYKNKI